MTDTVHSYSKLRAGRWKVKRKSGSANAAAPTSTELWLASRTARRIRRSSSPADTAVRCTTIRGNHPPPSHPLGRRLMTGLPATANQCVVDNVARGSRSVVGTGELTDEGTGRNSLLERQVARRFQEVLSQRGQHAGRSFALLRHAVPAGRGRHLVLRHPRDADGTGRGSTGRRPTSRSI